MTRLWIFGAILTACGASASAQQFPFQIRVSEAGNAIIVSNGAALGFSAPIGQAETATVTATYQGSGTASITQAPTVLGSTAFTVNSPTGLPLTLHQGDNVSFDIVFRPANASQANAQVSLPFSEMLPGAGAGQPTTVNNTINLSLQGGAPSFVLSYVLQTDQNVIPLQPGGTILFPATPINTTAQASLNITNNGSASGRIQSVSISGAAFKLVGLPLFPVTVGAGQTLQLLVRYQPTGVGSDSGQIQVTYEGGQQATINLQGGGSSAMLVYELLQGDTPTQVNPGGQVPLPDTNIGDTSSVTIRVRNAGNGTGTVSSINLVGAGFAISNPPLLPQTLAPGASFTFTISFAPTQPGDFHGRLYVGTDSFDVAGRGLGPKLVFSYNSGGTTITLPASGGAVVFSPVMISQTAQTDFVIRNDGTLPATVSNIGIGEQKSPFAVSGLPNLPLSLDPGTQVDFPVTFTPTTTGFSNGTLRIDTTSVGLTGSGTAPPPLPAYTLSGPSGNAGPMSQPAVGLKLSSPYPVALNGTLTLSATGDLPSDPSVQFATGGRTVAFSIPANSTDATFGSQGTQIRLQTGTVAGSITLTPSFTTQAGGVDVTPDSPMSLQFSVAPAAPALIAAQVTSTSASGFVLAVSGFTTTRSLSALNVQFTAAQGFNVPTTQLTVDLKQASTLWFQSTGSQAFGGQFTISVPFTLQGAPPAGHSLIESIASVSVSANNDVGASNSLQTKVP